MIMGKKSCVFSHKKQVGHNSLLWVREEPVIFLESINYIIEWVREWMNKYKSIVDDVFLTCVLLANTTGLYEEPIIIVQSIVS